MLEEALELSRENHTMLKRLRKSQKNAQLLRGLYWVFVIAIGFGAYTYLGPYLKKAVDVYNAAQNGISTITNFGNTVTNKTTK
jgi:predicted MFS family arabinose efflux permease